MEYIFYIIKNSLNNKFALRMCSSDRTINKDFSYFGGYIRSNGLRNTDLRSDIIDIVPFYWEVSKISSLKFDKKEEAINELFNLHKYLEPSYLTEQLPVVNQQIKYRTLSKHCKICLKLLCDQYDYITGRPRPYCKECYYEKYVLPYKSYKRRFKKS